MEFPISRERLRNIKHEIEKANMKKAIENLKLELCKNVQKYGEEIIRDASYGKVEYVVKLFLRYASVNITTLRSDGLSYVTKPVELMTKQEQLDYTIEQLKLKFPDCEYIIDPLQTYILIRW